MTSPRPCLRCGAPIQHRKSNAKYCSGDCRDQHNRDKRALVPKPMRPSRAKP
jgi:predicted nucleic acid-binding Zn ribbon protein